MKFGITKIEGCIQHYAWGGKDFLPELLGKENPQQEPYAEYWLGAHKNAPSVIKSQNKSHSLDALIQDNPDYFLGESIASRFQGQLPYLFKVLDVKEMLSIQVHPSKAAAEMGFARENREGVPLSANHRNYKDNNHKPEIMLALSDFFLLHGFKGVKEIRSTLETIPEFHVLLPYFEKGNYRGLYQHLMQLPQKEVDNILSPLVTKTLLHYKANQLTKDRPDFWAARAVLQTNHPTQNIDRGIFSIYLFNLLHLKKGQVIFQDAGVPHAYLDGKNIELMANSDNVLRGGLTPKHIDVAELLQHVRFEETIPQLIKGEVKNEHETTFPTSASDFELSKIEFKEAGEYIGNPAHSLDILIVLEGQGLKVREFGGNNEITFSRGEAFMVPAGVAYKIAASSSAQLFRASVPIP